MSLCDKAVGKSRPPGVHGGTPRSIGGINHVHNVFNFHRLFFFCVFFWFFFSKPYFFFLDLLDMFQQSFYLPQNCPSPSVRTGRMCIFAPFIPVSPTLCGCCMDIDYEGSAFSPSCCTRTIRPQKCSLPAQGVKELSYRWRLAAVKRASRRLQRRWCSAHQA